ncbi:MAG: sugar phosphate isomerase/epimerase [Victivallales bacterium]|nr:sugar phosphate isomerase/epimerase [Victivallales bacterium]
MQIEYDFSASTGLYYNISLPDAVKRIAKLGFNYVELYRHSWEINDVLNELKDIFCNSSIKPVAWHEHNELIFWAEDPRDVYFIVKQVKQHLDICAALEIPYLTLHYDFNAYPNHPEASPTEHIVFKAFPEIIEYASSNGIIILFENTGVLSKFIYKLCRMLDSPNIGVCLDIGHANLFENIEEAIKNGGDIIKCLHISDNFGMRKDGGFSDLHLAPGEGAINWRKCVHLLKKIKYKGVLNFELNGSQYARSGVADIKGWGNYLPLKARDKLLGKAKAQIKQFL